MKRLAGLQSGDSISADKINETGEYPVYGGNGLRGYTSSYTHDGYFALVGRQGALCGNVNYASGRFWASEHAVVVSPTASVDTRWLGELLRAMNLNQYSTSAAQPGLSVEMIGNLQTVRPPHPEQVAIARFLNREVAKIEALIAEQQRLIELLQEKRQAVISHAVTKGLNPDAQVKPSGVEWLGDVPAGWEIERLGALFREVSDTGSDTLPILSVSIRDGVSDTELADEEVERLVTRSNDRTKYKRVTPGDLVYNMMRAWQGAFGTVAVDGQVSPAYVVARPRLRIVTDFIERVLRTPRAVEEMRRRSRGVADFRLRLYWDEFKDMRIASPSYEEAAAVCSFADAAETETNALIAEATRSISLLQERRTALISAAVTGKIDVRNYSTDQADAA